MLEQVSAQVCSLTALEAPIVLGPLLENASHFEAALAHQVLLLVDRPHEHSRRSRNKHLLKVAEDVLLNLRHVVVYLYDGSPGVLALAVDVDLIRLDDPKLADVRHFQLHSRQLAA